MTLEKSNREYWVDYVKVLACVFYCFKTYFLKHGEI